VDEHRIPQHRQLLCPSQMGTALILRLRHHKGVPWGSAPS
jgi:hypothetical protein